MSSDTLTKNPYRIETSRCAPAFADVRTTNSHGENRGSSPLGSANNINGLSPKDITERYVRHKYGIVAHRTVGWIRLSTWRLVFPRGLNAAVVRSWRRFRTTREKGTLTGRGELNFVTPQKNVRAILKIGRRNAERLGRLVPIEL